MNSVFHRFALLGHPLREGKSVINLAYQSTFQLNRMVIVFRTSNSNSSIEKKYPSHYTQNIRCMQCCLSRYESSRIRIFYPSDPDDLKSAYFFSQKLCPLKSKERSEHYENKSIYFCLASKSIASVSIRKE